MPLADVRLRPAVERRERWRQAYLAELQRRRETDIMYNLTEREYLCRMIEIGILTSAGDESVLRGLAESVVQRLT